MSTITRLLSSSTRSTAAMFSAKSFSAVASNTSYNAISRQRVGALLNRSAMPSVVQSAQYTSAAELRKMASRVKKIPAFRVDPNEVPKDAVTAKTAIDEDLTLSQAASKHYKDLPSGLDQLSQLRIPVWYKEGDGFPYPENLRTLVADIKKLNHNELAYLCEVIKDEFKLTDEMIENAGTAAPAAGSGDAGKKQEDAKPKEKTDFAVKLEGFPADAKLKVVKQVRLVMPELSIVEAKNIVEGVPKVLKEKLPKADAEKMKAKLEEVGAKVVIE
eukprot:TRINITY_DN3754_c0_g1_i1.p1 TRINITY_DN3754_c0_g1~~TRINITY_DN3754_c0_g1_i1.p1  ORF type:complete len:273 (+),score=80.44 TRINITY_DN3754_c0_g1_i1:48-866(+)